MSIGFYPNDINMRDANLVSQNVYYLTLDRYVSIVELINRGSLTVGNVHRDNPLDAIISVYQYPFRWFNEDYGTDKVIIGEWDSGIDGVLLNSAVRHSNLGTIKIERYFNDFRDFPPFTKYELHLPYANTIELNPYNYINRYLTLYLYMDLIHNTATYYLVDVETKFIYESINATIGTRVSLSSDNQAQYNAEVTKTLTNTLVNTAVASTIAGTIIPNPAAVASTVIGGAMNMINTTLYSPRNYTKGDSGDSVLKYLSPNTAFIQIHRPKVNTIINASIAGRPLMDNRQLNTLKGYTKVGDIHLTGFDTATSDEITEVERLLKQGVIL